MWASASRSSWPVETPGLRASSTSCRTSATTRPAWRIRAISAFDLRVTMSGRLEGLVDRREQLGGDLGDGQMAVGRHEQATVAVVGPDLAEGGQGQGHPSADGLGLVVLALEQLGAVQVAHAGAAG